jgi:FHS family Na+ dependent glucose MFS transporter 1
LNPISLRFRQNIGYFSALFLLGLIVASLGPTLATLAEQTDSGLRYISLLFIARSMGFVVGSLWVGGLYDRVNVHAFFFAGLIMMGGMVVVTPSVEWLAGLMLVFFLQGMTGSIVNVGGNTLVVWANRDRVGPLINGLHFIWGVGASISPILMTWTMVYSGGIRLGYRLLALLAIPIALWVVRLPGPTPTRVTDRPIEERGAAGLPVLIGLFLFLYTGVESSIGNWIFTYGSTAIGLPATQAAYLNSIYWGTLTVGRLVFIPLTIRVRPRVILLSALAGALGSTVLLLLTPQAGAGLWLGVAGLGLSLATIFPTTLAFAERRITLTGRLTGRFFASSSGGAMVLPWLIGQFYETTGPRVLLWVVGGGIVSAGVIFFRMMSFPRKEEGQG